MSAVLLAGGLLTMAWPTKVPKVHARLRATASSGPPIAFTGSWFLLVGPPLDGRPLLKSWWCWSLGLMVALSLALDVVMIATP